MSVRTRPTRVGLTGGIGSGKSTVAAGLIELGATLVDTDAIARAITQGGGAAVPEIAAQFGAEMLDAGGALDRVRMRELAFSDPTAKRRLEAILHPMIGQEALRQADLVTTDVVVFDVPLMSATSPWRARCERIVVIDCSVEVQVRRVIARSGWDEAQVRSVIAQQVPRTSRRAIADAVIDNDALTLAELSQAVTELWQCWTTSGLLHRPAAG